MINQHGITEYPNSIKRQYSAPLEYYYSFNSWENANEYAQKNPTAYEGQIVAVTQNNDRILLYYLAKSIFSDCNYDLILMSDSEKYGKYSLINQSGSYQINVIPDISYLESYRIIHDDTVIGLHYDFISDNQIIDYNSEDDVINTLKFICEKKDENNKYVETMRLDTKVIDNNELFTIGYLYKTPKVGSYKVQKSSDTTIKIIISLSGPYNIIKKELMKQTWTLVEMPSGTAYECLIDSNSDIIIDISQYSDIEDIFSNENNIINLKPANTDINFIFNLSKEAFNKDGNIVSGKLYKGEYNIKIENSELLQYYGTTNINPSPESYFTVNDTGEAITGLTAAGSNQTNIIIPYKINGNIITTIESGAFNSKSSIQTIIIPNSIIDMHSNIFSACYSLNSINIPNGITKIEAGTFRWCESLTTINLPDTIQMIDSSAFSGCTSLVSINTPKDITQIGYNTFENCTSLTSIIIPKTVIFIGDDAFKNCSALTIYCEQGSYAETYANKYSIPVVYTNA